MGQKLDKLVKLSRVRVKGYKRLLNGDVITVKAYDREGGSGQSATYGVGVDSGPAAPRRANRGKSTPGSPKTIDSSFTTRKTYGVGVDSGPAAPTRKNRGKSTPGSEPGIDSSYFGTSPSAFADNSAKEKSNKYDDKIKTGQPLPLPDSPYRDTYMRSVSERLHAVRAAYPETPTFMEANDIRDFVRGDATPEVTKRVLSRLNGQTDMRNGDYKGRDLEDMYKRASIARQAGQHDESQDLLQQAYMRAIVQGDEDDKAIYHKLHSSYLKRFTHSKLR